MKEFVILRSQNRIPKCDGHGCHEFYCGTLEMANALPISHRRRVALFCKD